MKSIVLLSIGIILFAIGISLLISGVKIEMCSYVVHIPRSFEGRIDPRYTEWLYWANIPVNVSDFHVYANTTKTLIFDVNKSIGWIQITIVGEPVNPDYKGVLTIANASNPTQVYLRLSLDPAKSIRGSGMNITSMFLTSLNPGTYILSLMLDTDAYIKRLTLSGPSATEVEVVAPKITFTPSAYDQIDVRYVCGISFSYLLISVVVISIGMAIVTAGSILAHLYVHGKGLKTVKGLVKPTKKIKT